ncbi:small polypeptide DEVIL 4-like [Phragmites australis]|nr:small polypeptide DEVIL 4-like [Phragmites australis]
MKLTGSSKRTGGLGRALREHKARLYIIQRCVIMLLRWDD